MTFKSEASFRNELGGRHRQVEILAGATHLINDNTGVR